MKHLSTLLVIFLAFGCQLKRHSVNDTYGALTGTVIRREWSKSSESWNAGGSEYFVLKIDGNQLSFEKRAALQDIVLFPSEAIQVERISQFVGRVVKCKGEFISGTPYQPSANSVEQMPAKIQNPITDAIDYPNRGSGFKVYAITPVRDGAQLMK